MIHFLSTGILVFSLFISTHLQAVPVHTTHSYGDLTVSKLENVHDGDTFKVSIEGLHPLIGHNILVRVAGIDTPELHSKEPQIQKLAYRARDYTASLLSAANEIVLKDVRRDKYFRILADVYVDGLSLSEELLKAGFAQPYDGKTKPIWHANQDREEDFLSNLLQDERY